MARAFALLLAIVPFSPPAGWTVDPVFARQAIPFVWVPRSLQLGAEQPRIWAELVPAPNPLELADDAATADIPGMSATESDATLCGAAAKVVEIHSQASDVSDADSVYERSHGYSYIVTYSRARGASVDPAAEQFIRRFCPSSPNAVPSVGSPTGWALIPPMHALQAWSDTSLKQHIEILTGAPAASLSLVADTILAPFVGQPDAVVRNLRPLTLCGHAATESTLTLTIAGIPVAKADIIATQSASRSYLLEYLATTPSAAALAALHAFCPT